MLRQLERFVIARGRYLSRKHDAKARLAVFAVVGIVIVGFFLRWEYHRFFLEHSVPVPAQGGILTESTLGTVRNLNPLSPDVSLFDRDLHQLLYSGLLRYDPQSAQLQDALANLRIAEDGKTYYLTLKSSAEFSNGAPVTVRDVLFTYQDVIQNPHFPNESLRNAFEYITISPVDDRTISFVLPEQNVYFPWALTTPVLPADSFQNALIEEVIDPDYPFNRAPLSTGPYRLRSIIPNDDGSFRVFLERNKHYYGSESYIDQIVFYVYPDIEDLKVLHTWTTLYSRLPYAQVDALQKDLFDLYQEREYILPRFTGLFFELDKPIVSNLYFRKALLSALPKERLLAKESGWQRIDSPLFFDGVESWHVNDFIEARKLFRDHGFPYNDDLETRTNGKGGDPIELTLLTSTSPAIYSRLAQNIARIWQEELALKVKVQILPPDEFASAVKNREYDILLFGQDYAYSFDPLSTWHSSQSGKINLSNLTNQSVDFVISELRFSGSQSDLLNLNERLDTILPAVAFATPKYKLLVHEDLKGFHEGFGKIRSHAQRFAGVEHWYFQTEPGWDWPENRSKIWGFLRWLFGSEKTA